MWRMSKVDLFNSRYTYCHDNTRGFPETIDVHEITISRSKGRNFFSFFCILLVLLHVSHLLLVKESLVVCVSGVFLSVFIAKLWLFKAAKKESVVIMPAFGVQVETHYWSGRVTRRFISIGKILKPVLNEVVTPVTCYWSLALILRGEDKLVLVFQVRHIKVFDSHLLILETYSQESEPHFCGMLMPLQESRPPLKMLVPIWKALCAATNGEVCPDTTKVNLWGLNFDSF